ncbi:MAG: hypothetical protein ABI686_07205 [Acidobacteriota bacterium]
METTTVTISLPKEVGIILEKRAEDSGKDFETYIKNIVETQAKKMTLDETLAPIRQAVEKSGLNEDELDGIFQQARREVSQARKERKIK